MSFAGVEKALYDLNTDRRARETFTEDPDRFSRRYRLTGDELRLLIDRDVRALAGLGANPMLVWGFWLMLPAAGERGNKAYLARMRGEVPASGGPRGE
ncbi:aromatic-ring opening dioxygenase LigAB LigA subunit [Actinomadura pelletieri DSM 43383]|uniref:Aromatic-ring opening dioxygenase LigAB LigA subunit n=1 Tax=Actinomadura pelletieri DSM 43383 TaxID=1120940 RepID=A0A495QTC0_9ACTN|nr:hypothetical protein [Actinomadura pelletieri]RKS76678.1 aromatic-ring opening dioxygenase LigAB LigA subunit [Actinomadura pelletieri DSM 43383]